MQTRHPNVFISVKIPYGLHKRSVILGRSEKHKMEVLTIGHIFGGFKVGAPIFELFQIQKINI
jgi:hypothetical protein